MANRGDTRPLQTSCPGTFLLLAPFDSFPIRQFSLKKTSKSRGRVHHATCLLYLNHCWSQLGVDVQYAKANKKRRGIDNTQGLWGLGDKGALCRIGQGGCVGGGRGRERGARSDAHRPGLPGCQAGSDSLFSRARSGCSVVYLNPTAGCSASPGRSAVNSSAPKSAGTWTAALPMPCHPPSVVHAMSCRRALIFKGPGRVPSALRRRLGLPRARKTGDRAESVSKPFVLGVSKTLG